MREIERVSDAAGHSYAQMMHNAGYAAAAVIRRRFPAWFPGRKGNPVRVVILVGPGNNGGDGLVCATALNEHDDAYPVDARAYCLKRRSAADAVYQSAIDAGITVCCSEDDPEQGILADWLKGADIVVDALLGTGVARPIEGTLASVLNRLKVIMAGKKLQLVALDGVTGMNYEMGSLDPCAPQADLTVTFHAPKRGHYCYPAARANGELVIVSIGVPQEDLAESHFQPSEQISLADDEVVQGMLPVRAPDANKGTYGKVIVLGGCMDYAGAPTLAAAAAYRAGAGLVTMGVPAGIQVSATILCREATFITMSDAPSHLTPAVLSHIEKVMAVLDRRHAWVIGPGIGQNKETGAFLRGFLDLWRAKSKTCQLVIDADGLNHLSQMDGWPQLLPPMTVLTPHPGEMGRLTGLTVHEIQSNRMGVAMQYAQKWQTIVVLKGAFTVIAHPTEGAVVLPFTNPALAVAGTGDVLAGCIGGLLAQGIAPYCAALCGAYLHASAGEMWRVTNGDAGLLAGDLLSYIPKVMIHLRECTIES